MKTKKVLKPWVKNLLQALGIIIIISSIIMVFDYLSYEDDRTLEKKSTECAVEGYGIKVSYTKEGDKYYVCNSLEGK